MMMTENTQSSMQGTTDYELDTIGLRAGAETA